MYELQISDQTMVLSTPGERGLTLRESVNGGEVTLFLEGSVTVDLAPFVTEELLMAALVFQTIVLDLEKTESLCANCYEGFLSAQRKLEERKNTSLYLRRVPREIMEDLAQIGYDCILDVRDE